MSSLDFEGFARKVLQIALDGYDPDGGEIQELALKHGLIVEIPGGYDPEKHGHSFCCEPGDTWYEVRAALSGEEASHD